MSDFNNAFGVTHAGCTTSSQNICVQSLTGLVPSAPISASVSANCQSTSLSMSPSSRSSRILRCVFSSSSSEDGCTLRLFCACDGTGMGRTGTEGHSPGRDSLRRWRSICNFTLQWVEQIIVISVHGYARQEGSFGFPHSLSLLNFGQPAFLIVQRILHGFPPGRSWAQQCVAF